ncbi:MAG: hypothetical protein M1290_00665, partial [Candidatus Thermoplasmatota archaeon]|nr:hypothetical protein [Candidatus Thermoplasmatota archaeon]
MANSKTKSLMAISLLIVLLMIFSGFYGLFPSGSSSPNTASHIYVVTESIGGKNYSYYEEVRNNTVVKTWPAPAAPIASSNVVSTDQRSVSLTSGKESLKPLDSDSSQNVFSEVNASLSNIYTWTLPEAEKFTVGSNSEAVNFISLYLSGSGTVYVGIGTSLFSSNLFNTTVQVTASQVWYNISISSAITLSGSTPYFLNVFQKSGNVQWGYTSSPSVAKNDKQDYYYAGGSLYNDDSFPDIYTIGYYKQSQTNVYSVTFSQSGLTSGNWYVNITGQQSSGPISYSSTFTTSLPDGTYSYTVSSGNDQYSPSQSSGSFTVNGGQVSESVTFTQVSGSNLFSITPSSGTVYIGGTLTASYSGSGSGTYYWWGSTSSQFTGPGTQELEKITVSGGSITGGSVLTLANPPINPGPSGQEWNFEVAGSSGPNPGTVYSPVVTLTVENAPSFTISPSQSSISFKGSVTLTAAVTGSPPPPDGTYYWWASTSPTFSGPQGGSNYGFPSDLIKVSQGKITQGGSLTVGSNYTAGSTWYLAITSNDNPPSSADTDSNVVTITVSNVPSVSVSPATIDSGQRANLTATAAGGSGSGFVFKWYSDSSLTNLVHTGSTFETPSLSSSTTYYVTVTDSSGSTSPAVSVTVTVNPLPTIEVQPQGYEINVTQSFLKLNSTVQFGTPPYTWQWYQVDSQDNDTVGQQGSGATATFTPNSVGVYFVVFTDSVNESVQSSLVDVKYYTSLSISPTSSSLDLGQYQIFSASSGSENWQYYHWQLGTASGPSGSILGYDSAFNFTTSGYSATASSPGTYYLWLTAGNYYPQLNATAMAVITISPKVITTLSPSSDFINVTQSVIFSNQTSGGLAPYTYSWSVSPSNGVTNLGNNFTFTKAGIYNVTLRAKDARGETASSYAVITVGALPEITPSSASLSIGQYQIFSESSALQYWSYINWQLGSVSGPSGQVLGYNQNYNFSTTGFGSTVSSPGTYYLWVTVGNYYPEMSKSTYVVVTVTAALNVTVAASSSTLDVGESPVTLTATASGGSGTYSSYSWYYESPGASSFTKVTGESSSTISFSSSSQIYSTAGQYMFRATVTDSNGAISPYSSVVTVTVSADPTVSISPKGSITLDTGQSFNLTASLNYSGSNAVSVEWYSNNANSTSTGSDTGVSGDSFKVPTSSQGTTYYYAVAKDSAVPAWSYISNVVKVSVSTLGVSLSTSTSSIYEGQTEATLTATASGGSGSYSSYSWYYESPGSSTYVQISGISSSTYIFSSSSSIFTTTGTYGFEVTVKDSNGVVSSASSTVSVTVNPAISVSITSSKSVTVDAGQTFNVTGTVSGGTGTGYKYAWLVINSESPSTPSSFNSTSGSISNVLSMASSNTYYVFLFGEDSGGVVFQAPGYIVVTVRLAVLPSITSQSNISTNTGESITLTGDIEGGSGQFLYAWIILNSPGTHSVKPDSFNPSNTSSEPVSSNLYFLQSGVYYTYLYAEDANSPQGNPCIEGTSNYITVSVSSSNDQVFSVSQTSNPSNQGPFSTDQGQNLSLTASLMPNYEQQGNYNGFWYVSTSTPTWNTEAYKLSLNPITVSNQGTTIQGQNPIVVNFSPSSPWFSISQTTYYIWISDSPFPGSDIDSNLITVTVSPSLVAQITSSSSVSVDAGQSFAATGTVSGGDSTGFGYAWVKSTTQSPSTPSSFNSTTGSFSVQISFSSSGSYYLYLYGTDSNGAVVRAAGFISVTVSPALKINPSPSPSTVDPGQSSTISASASGGYGSYTYQWYEMVPGGSFTPISGATSSSYIFSTSGSTSSGTYEFYVSVTDGNQNTVNDESNPVTVVVNSPLSSAISPGTKTIDAGQSVTFTNSTTGGSSPYKYSWSVSPSSGWSQGSTSATYNTFTFTSTGTYTVALKVTDALGYSVASTAIITVNSQPAVSVTPVTIDNGQSATLSASATGGSGTGYVFKWYSSSSLTTLLFTGNPFVTAPLTSGVTYYVTVTDSLGGVSSAASVSVTVNPVLTLTISPSSSNIDAGQSVSFTNTTTGGSSTYSYSWSVSQSSGWSQGSTQSTYNTFTFTSPGTYTLTLKVTDSLGSTASSRAAVTVNADPTVSISPSGPLNYDQGQTAATLTATITYSGQNTVTVEWFSNSVDSTTGGTDLGHSGTTYVPSTSSSGTTYYFAVVRDSGLQGFSAFSNVVEITVNNPLAITISSSSQSLDQGQSVTFTNTTTGGASPFKYSYSVIPSTGWTQNGNSFTFTSPGTYKVYLNVTDADGASATSLLTITVYSLPTVSVNSVTIDYGQTATLTATASGGSGSGYVYRWYSDSALTNLVYTGNPLVTAPLTSSRTYYVTATDSNGGISTPQSALITVNPELSITLSASSAFLDAGQSLTFTNITSGGTGVYEYTWKVTPSTGYSQGVTQSTYNTFTFTSSGTFNIELEVTDSLGSHASDSSSITVYADPTVSVTPSGPLSYDVGQTASALTATVTYSGKNTASVEWYSNTADSTTGGTDTGKSGTTFTPSTSSTGTTYYYAVVSDSALPGYSSYSNIIKVVITPDPTVSINPSSSSIDISQSVTFTNTTSGGISPYTYSWAVSPSTGWSQGSTQ